MERKIIEGLWERINLKNINDNFETLFDGVVDDAELKADVIDALEKARQANADNVDIRQQINDLIIDSGNSDAEVVQARGSFSVLGERLDGQEELIGQDPYYSEITYEQLFDEPSNTSYYLTTIPHKDKNGNIIKVKHGIARGTINAGLETARQFSERENPSFVANASVFNTTTNKILGIQIRDGVILQSTPHPTSYTLGIKADNTMISTPPTVTAEELLGMGVVNAFTAFFPLLTNGVPTEESIYATASPNSMVKNPRQIVAQKANKDILIITTQGRGYEGEGMTYAEAIDLCLYHGATFAYNLDGGGSTQSISRGTLLNTPIDGSGKVERGVVDFLYFDKPRESSDIFKSFSRDVGHLSKKLSDVKVDVGTLLGEFDSNGNGEFRSQAKSVSNANSIRDSGFYWITNTATASPGDYSYGLLHFQVNETSAMQIAFPYHNSLSEIKYRRTIGNMNSWTDWRTNSPRAEWTTISLQNGWSNYGGNEPTAAYAVKNGIVYLRGLIQGGTDSINSLIGNIPAEYRPQARHYVSTLSSGADGYMPSRFFIDTNGDIKYMNGGNNWYILTTSYPL
ncbi:phosphodiester glycosidase family protein [Mammaliicoccus sciuri]|uniref:phosphodiester glycosidase family protein n=1 Tax=Mammaliicoccus sciuri TaxID=1296 RepID=UPI0034DDBD58